MKVAFTSSDGRTIDQHFGQATQYCIWEIDAERAEPLGKVSPLLAATPDVDGEGVPSEEAAGSDLEDRTAARANAVAGCAIVCTVQIGGPAAAKLVARRIHPMKTGGEVPIAEMVARLQGVLRGTPPPWLRKAIGAGGKRREGGAADPE
jgi:nitrogen fixation protein NifX